MASKFFPSTKNLVPTFYFPEYDPQDLKSVATRTFNASTLHEALQDPTGIFQGRNYGSSTGYIDNEVTKRVYSALIEEHQKLETYIDTENQQVSQMIIYDLFGHSSGLPLGILRYRQVGFYVSYSVSNDQTRFQLIRNAKVYGFASKLSVLSDLSEPGVLEKGTVVLLPNSIDSLGMSAFDFVSFNRNSIWIAVIFSGESKVPKGFKLQVYQGFSLWINESSTVWETAATNQPVVDGLKRQRVSLASNTKVENYVPSFYEESVSVKEIPFEDLPIIKFDVSKLKTRDVDVAKLLSAEWMKQFEDFLGDILEQCKGKFKVKVSDLLTREYITKYWLRAFVHETVNAENNLESLETIGDSAINFAVKQMLYNYNHKFRADQITNLYKKLTSKKGFGEYSRKIGLVRFAVLAPGVDLTISISEDILEAFAAAMVLAGDAYQDGFGMVLVKNFVHLLMFDDLFGSEEALEVLQDNLLNDKSTLIGTDYTNFVGKGSFEGSLRTTGDSAVYTMFVTDKGMEALQRLGFNPTKLRRRYVATDEDPKAAKESANELLFRDLKRIGLTYSIYEKAKQQKKWSQSPALYNKYLAAKDIAEKKGYSDIIVKIPESAKTLTKMVLILIGQSPEKNYNLQVLSHQMDKGSVSEVNRHLATVRLLENFIEKNS